MARTEEQGLTHVTTDPDVIQQWAAKRNKLVDRESVAERL